MLANKPFFTRVVIALLCIAFSSTHTVGKKYVIGCWQAGFFSSFCQIVNHLVACEKHKRTPVVYWDQNSFFYQRNGYNGSYNAWEYYFEPVSPLSYTPGDKIHADYFARSKFFIPWAPIQACYSPKLRVFVHQIIQRYIRIKPVILAKINAFKQEKMQGITTIGIHLRGTDKRKEVQQTNPLGILNHANYIANCVGQNCQFFIATDEEKLLELARQTLNRPVICYNSIRSTTGQAVHINGNDNKALLGEQVLIEAKLLSECEYLLHTLSNVSMAACYFNPQVKSIAFDSNGTIVRM